MEIVKSRNGFYTLTFEDKENLDESQVLKDFNTVGKVVNIRKRFSRYFIRYRFKDEAERAIKKFTETYNVSMAINSESQHNESSQLKGQVNSNNYKSNNNSNSQNNIHYNNKKQTDQVKHNNFSNNKNNNNSQEMEKVTTKNKFYHLILGNIPKSYTTEDVHDLVEEAKPIHISELDETKVFGLKFCQIILSSPESLAYLVDKLDGFVLCKESLIAVDMERLLEWRGNGL